MSINAIADFPGEKLLPVVAAKVMGCTAVVAMILGAIVLAGHLLPPSSVTSSLTFFSMKTALLVTAAGTVSLALAALAKRRTFLKVVSVIALFAIAFYIVFPDTSWAKYIEAGAIMSGVVIFTSFALLLQRKASTSAIMNELLACEKIELDAPYLHASLHHWIAKEKARPQKETGISQGQWQTFLLGIQGKTVHYRNTGFEIRFNTEPLASDSITLAENSKGVKQAYLESFGVEPPAGSCVCLVQNRKVLGGAFYKVHKEDVCIYDVCRRAHAVGLGVVRRTLETIQGKNPGKKLLVYVLEGNPARKVYEKYGFSVRKLIDTGHACFLEMEQAPQAPSS